MHIKRQYFLETLSFDLNLGFLKKNRKDFEMGKSSKFVKECYECKNEVFFRLKNNFS